MYNNKPLKTLDNVSFAKLGHDNIVWYILTMTCEFWLLTNKNYHFSYYLKIMVYVEK